MPLENWLAFTAASFVIGIIPGPGVTMIVGYALSAGRRAAMSAVAGAALGNFTSMSLSLAGVGAVLAASALAFTLLKWAGAAYLIGLGLFTIAKTLKSAPAAVPPPAAPRLSFLGAFAVTALNPKTIVFFVAFAPQFMSPAHALLPQSALLVATFVALVAATDAAYAWLASSFAPALRGPRMRRWTERAGGGALVGAGLAAAAARAN
jgi:threonine/homoserine/homoserine lactone efflux protein